MTENLLLQNDSRGVATLTLNRPEKHNAFDDGMIAELTAKLAQLDRDENVRVVVLTGAGKSFSAGADLNWLRSMAGYGERENLEDSLKLADLMDMLNGLHKPTIARVNGATFGGGVGLVACCDIAIAADNAKFCLSEVRLGLVPSVISPYVIAAIGVRQARRYFLNAEVIEAARAREIGLVHEVAPVTQLDEAVNAQIELLLKGGPQALATCKRLIADNDARSTDERNAFKRDTAKLIAELRVSTEGQEGLGAFLEKRKPDWAADKE